MGYGCLAPHSSIFQLYPGTHFFLDDTELSTENHQHATSHIQMLSLFWYLLYLVIVHADGN